MAELMTKLTVAVVTPSYNQASFIEETIESVLNQSVKPVEYIIVDGNSTDNTLAILNRYSGRLTWLSEADDGQAHAVNKGIQQTSAEIIGWLNSDDTYEPNTIALVTEFFAAHPEIDIVYGNANHIDREGRITGLYPACDWNLQQLKAHCFIPQPAVFFRRRLIERFGLLNQALHFCLDYEYWLRMATNGATFAYLPQTLANARIYPEAKSSCYPLKMYLEVMTMLKARLGYIPANWLVNYALTKTKIDTGLHHPDPRYLFSSWQKLWGVAGLHYHGLHRWFVWMDAQKNFATKIVGKLVHS